MVPNFAFMMDGGGGSPAADTTVTSRYRYVYRYWIIVFILLTQLV